jgi:hypothetical protein
MPLTKRGISSVWWSMSTRASAKYEKPRRSVRIARIGADRGRRRRATAATPPIHAVTLGSASNTNMRTPPGAENGSVGV